VVQILSMRDIAIDTRFVLPYSGETVHSHIVVNTVNEAIVMFHLFNFAQMLVTCTCLSL